MSLKSYKYKCKSIIWRKSGRIIMKYNYYRSKTTNSLV